MYLWSGGGTLVPCIRNTLQARFKNTNHRVDPLTIVATGAALFASTQKLNVAHAVLAKAGGFDLKLAYTPVSSELDCEVGVIVSPVEAGMTVTITRADKGWSSGAIPVPPDGRVVTTIALRAKKLNAFGVHLRNFRGELIVVDASIFTVSHGVAPTAQATSSYAFSVALADNGTHVVVPKTTPLPAKGSQRLLAAHTVKAQDPESVLKVQKPECKPD